MAKATEKLDGAAAAGFDGQENPHIYSSPMWYAHELGRAFKACGRPQPTDVRMSRGYNIRCRDMMFKIGGTKSVPTFERTS
jgi:hypothetical protein